jgi:hypothetical protein
MVLEQRRALAAQDDVEAVGATPRIGQLLMSGSPSKYIWVTSRCTQPSPEIA